MLLTVAPVISLATAQTNVANAQAALDQAIAAANTQADQIMTNYHDAMSGHQSDYNSAVDGLVATFTTQVESANLQRQRRQS